MFKSRVVLLVSMLALAAPAFAQQVDPDRMVRPYWWDKPVVEALGRALLEVEPNRANFSIAFVETDGQSAKAMELAVAKAKLAQDAVKKIAGDKARVKTSVSVEPYYEQYRDKDGNIQSNTRSDKVKGYEARASMTVLLYDIGLAGRARAAALALGPQDSGSMNIYLEQTVEMQRAALKAAAQDARARAEATAAAAGSNIGELLVLQEGNGPCMGNWSTRQVARETGGGGGFIPGTPPPPPRPVEVYSSQAEKVIVTGARIGGKQIDITEADITRLDLPSDNDKQTIQSAVCAVYLLKK